LTRDRNEVVELTLPGWIATTILLRRCTELVTHAFGEVVFLVVSSLAAGAVVAASGWFSLRYAWWRRPINWEFPRVLMYHMISEHRPGTRFNKLRVRPKCFADQLQWLTRNGFTFVFASELFSMRPLPARTVCLTFDDGYADNLTNADPLLRQFHARATLFLVADRQGGWSSKKKAHHSDDELAAEPKLSDDQVSHMLSSGRWELGGHTRTHCNLAAVTAAQAREEVMGPSFELTPGITWPAPTFAYPFGIYGRTDVDLVREAGFLGAFTTVPAISAWPYHTPFEVPRIKVSGMDTLFAFKLRMRGGKRGLFQ
jgi:peptidoglycan/xylan/chitin deacetylase (PgdA/CDA1 family)